MAGAAGILVCSTCGGENAAGSRFCASCGSLLTAEARSATETRKVVTVLFSDLAGSTELGDELDPESLRQLMTRYFQEMGAVVRRHGGTTEKFIGDAIMAVFGVPRLHEDDALRAVRAAVAMRQGLEGLNEEFEAHWGVRIVTRTGVNTGEVVAGDSSKGESFVTGDAVNVAARLEQAAGPGEIFIGETTYRLVRDIATTAPIAPLSVKGKSESVAAWSLVDVAPAPLEARRLESALIGRDREFAALEEVLARTVEARSCELVTVMGPAGVGKSRLTREFLPRLGDQTTVLVGRCLPYGEGITFWPVVEIMRAAAGLSDVHSPDEVRTRIAGLLEGADAPLVAARLSALMGLADVTPGVQEAFWAVRKLFDELAARSPLVVVFDDIHWAEPTFLDLLEYLADTLEGVPVLLVCLARPELLEVRGDWMTSKANASLITLAPLSDTEMAGLIRNLLGGGELADEARGRIADAAEGNPLFVEETLRMLIDDGLLSADAGTWYASDELSSLTIPPTISALLTARLDRLDDEERAVIERASVIGRVFWWGRRLPPRAGVPVACGAWIVERARRVARPAGGRAPRFGRPASFRQGGHARCRQRARARGIARRT
jgi:class 3 adenylate cyclase